MRYLPICLLSIIVLAGCETAKVYDPLAMSTQQTFIINASALAQVRLGMSQSQVHQLMGDIIVIGYAYQKPLPVNEAEFKPSPSDYKPLTIANPYKTESVNTKDGLYTVEYYVSTVKEADGNVTDDELVPLVFRDGVLAAKGWDYVKALRLKNPS